MCSPDSCAFGRPREGTHSAQVLCLQSGARAPAMHFSCLSPSLGVRGCLLNYSPGVRKPPRGTTLSLGLQVPGLCPCQAR